LHAAVNVDFLRILKDANYGFTDVLPSTMLTHLEDTYGQISRDDIEENCKRLSMDLNVDEPIKALWIPLQEIQRFALAANEPITDATVIQLMLPIFEKNGVLGAVTEKWWDRPDDQWTFINFKAHFEKGNKERIPKLTAKAAGYHGANAATTKSHSSNNTIPTTISTNANSQNETAAAATSLTPNTLSICTNNKVNMYYFWSHGLGKNWVHTSATCNNKYKGHQDAATANKMMSGNNRIMTGEPFQNTTKN
jgi:hypothetical protein